MFARQELDRAVRNFPVLSSLAVPRAAPWPHQPRHSAVFLARLLLSLQGSQPGSRDVLSTGSCSCQTTCSASTTHGVLWPQGKFLMVEGVPRGCARMSCSSCRGPVPCTSSCAWGVAAFWGSTSGCRSHQHGKQHQPCCWVPVLSKQECARAEASALPHCALGQLCLARAAPRVGLLRQAGGVLCAPQSGLGLRLIFRAPTGRTGLFQMQAFRCYGLWSLQVK